MAFFPMNGAALSQPQLHHLQPATKVVPQVNNAKDQAAVAPNVFQTPLAPATPASRLQPATFHAPAVLIVRVPQTAVLHVFPAQLEATPASHLQHVMPTVPVMLIAKRPRMAALHVFQTPAAPEALANRLQPAAHRAPPKPSVPAPKTAVLNVWKGVVPTIATTCVSAIA